MADEPAEVIEQIQRMVAEVVATQPAGAGLCLVGGFRYRFLDRGVRRSIDIDYHCDGDRNERQAQLVEMFRRRLLPEVRRRLGLDGSVAAGVGAAESPATAVVELAFWNLGSTLGRLEVPVDVTHIECLDPPVVRTADGVVYRTASNADLFEAKAIAVVGRLFLEYRDLVDLYLFAGHRAADAASRIDVKCRRLKLDDAVINTRLASLITARVRHVSGIDEVIRRQLDPAAAASLLEAGGGTIVLSAVLDLLGPLFPRWEPRP